MAYPFAMLERQKHAFSVMKGTARPQRKFPTIPQLRIWLQVAVAMRILRMVSELPTVEERRQMLANLAQMFNLPIPVEAEGLEGLTPVNLPRWLGLRS